MIMIRKLENQIILALCCCFKHHLHQPFSHPINASCFYHDTFHINISNRSFYHLRSSWFYPQTANGAPEEEEEKEGSPRGPVILRRKRAAAKDKNTCQLFIQTDHLFEKYYGSREAVLAQVGLQSSRDGISDTRLKILFNNINIPPIVSADFQPCEGHSYHLPGHGLHGHPKHWLHGEKSSG